jgi:transposase
MTEELEGLKGRLVAGRKSDGRAVYDETAKAELVELCLRPGASVSRLARECGVNANQVCRWLREHRRVRSGPVVASAAPAAAAFVEVPVQGISTTLVAHDEGIAAEMSLQARLPNGVTLDVRGVDPRRVGEVIDALGRLRCSASTKG